MYKAKKLMVAAFLMAMSAPGGVSAQEGQFPYVSDLTNPDAAMQPQKDQITSYTELSSPFTHAITLQGRDGIAFVSQNGRFVLRGVIFDTWSGNTIQTMQELEDSKRTINLADLGIKQEDVDPMFFGSGPKKVTLFVDPLCPFCGQLFDQIVGDPTYARDYTFTIYTVPFLGDDSSKAVTVLSCAEDREAALKALLTKDRRWMASQPAPATCDVQPILQRTIMSQMIGVTGVPYIIGAEGGVARGMPQDLKTFLATN